MTINDQTCVLSLDKKELFVNHHYLVYQVVNRMEIELLHFLLYLDHLRYTFDKKRRDGSIFFRSTNLLILLIFHLKYFLNLLHCLTMVLSFSV